MIHISLPGKACEFCELTVPNGHTTSTPRWFDADITSKHQRPNFDEFPRHFHVLFCCNFADQKIHIVSTYFSRRNFNGRKIQVVSKYFFRYNFAGRIIHVVSTYFFFFVISMVKTFTLLLSWVYLQVSTYFVRRFCKLEEVFLCF